MSKIDIKPFKYTGTPEQIAQVVVWLGGQSVYEESSSRIGDGPYTTILADAFGCQLSSQPHSSYCFPPMPPEYELAIFGSTKGITGKPDYLADIPDVEYFVAPETPGKIVYNTESTPVNIPENTSEEVMDALGLTNGKPAPPVSMKITNKDGDVVWEMIGGSSVKIKNVGEHPVKIKGEIVPPDAYTANFFEGRINVSDYERRVSPASGPIKSDGGSSDYYKLVINTKDGSFACETGDVIAAMVGDNFALGNALKALRRIYQASLGQGKDGIDARYDQKKISYFVEDFVARMERV